MALYKITTKRKFENGNFTVFDSTTFPLHNASDLIETPYGDLLISSSGRNTQTGEESYIALYKNDVFKKTITDINVITTFDIALCILVQ